MTNTKTDLKSRIWEEIRRARPLPKYRALITENLVTADEEELHGEMRFGKSSTSIVEREGLVLDYFKDKLNWNIYVVLDVENNEIMRCGSARILGEDIPVVPKVGYHHDPSDYVTYAGKILEALIEIEDRRGEQKKGVTEKYQLEGVKHHVIETLERDKDLLEFLSEGCSAHFDTSTGEIAYIDPADNMARYGLLSIMKAHPELKMRQVADGLNSYLQANFSGMVPLKQLVQQPLKE